MLITRDDCLLSTAEAAQMVRVKPATIRQWRHRKRLVPAGFDENGLPLYHADDVARAEKLVHDNGLAASRGRQDPRAMRHANRVLAA